MLLQSFNQQDYIVKVIAVTVQQVSVVEHPLRSISQDHVSILQISNFENGYDNRSGIISATLPAASDSKHIPQSSFPVRDREERLKNGFWSFLVDVRHQLAAMSTLGEEELFDLQKIFWTLVGQVSCT